MRLDVFLFERGFCQSRTDAKSFILSGAVTVSGRVIKKPAYDISGDADDVQIDTSSKKFVSRGGLKLEAALDKFGISPLGRICLDIGASSGGFTDCLLKRGAEKVFAVDSGSGQLVPAIAGDPRVISYENYNARYMKKSDFTGEITLVVMDVSFISATYIIPSISEVVSIEGDFICLIKPQFELSPSEIGKGGIVKSDLSRQTAIKRVTDFADASGFSLIGLTESPIKGGDGNTEYLAHFKKGRANE